MAKELNKVKNSQILPVLTLGRLYPIQPLNELGGVFRKSPKRMLGHYEMLGENLVSASKDRLVFGTREKGMSLLGFFGRQQGSKKCMSYKTKKKKKDYLT